MALLERLLVALAQRHHRRHVDLVEGRQHRRGALRLDQPLGDRGAALRHADALFGAIAFGTAAIFGDRHGRQRQGAPCGACRGAAPARRRRAACSTSRRITRPASPLPRTRARSTSFSSAALRAVGVARGDFGVAGRFGLGGAAPRAAGAAAGFGAVALRRSSITAQHLADLHVVAVLARDAAEHAGLRRR